MISFENSGDRLAEIETREAAATKGPWRQQPDAGIVTDNGDVILAVFGKSGPDNDDAAFTAHSRDDVPWLADQLKRALERAAALEEENAKLAGEVAEAERAASDYEATGIELFGRRDAALRLVDDATEGRISADAVLARLRDVLDDDNPPDDDRRRRIYIDGKGGAWVSAGVDEDGTEYLGEIDTGRLLGEEAKTVVRDRTGGLREIGRCW